MPIKGRDFKKRFVEEHPESFDALTFGDLGEGDLYISFPEPGDNSGHGGFKGGFYVFRKVGERESSIEGLPDNSVNLYSGYPTNTPKSVPVLKLII